MHPINGMHKADLAKLMARKDFTLVIKKVAKVMGFDEVDRF